MIWIVLGGIGLGAGLASGLFGIGGGLLIVPALLWLMKFPPHLAAAVSLVALVLPLGAAIGAHEYYASGKIGVTHLGYGLVISLGMACGAFFGAKWGIALDQNVLRKAFAAFLVFAAILTWFKE